MFWFLYERTTIVCVVRTAYIKLYIKCKFLREVWALFRFAKNAKKFTSLPAPTSAKHKKQTIVKILSGILQQAWAMIPLFSRISQSQNPRSCNIYFVVFESRSFFQSANILSRLLLSILEKDLTPTWFEHATSPYTKGMSNIDSHTRPHNYYIQLAAETGILVLLTGCLMIGSIVLTCFSYRRFN